MDIIVISSRFSEAKCFKLNIFGVSFVLLTAVGLVLGFAAIINYFTLVYGVSNQSPYLHTFLEIIHEKETARTKSYLNENINNMARHMGEMQSKISRLEEIGDRVTKLAGLDPQKLKFASRPSERYLVGADGKIPGSLEQIGLEARKFKTLIDDRLDKLELLEARLTVKYVDKQLLPTGKPVKGGWYSSNFGWRIDPFTKSRAFHEGLDSMSPAGTPIKAAAGGVVVYSSRHPEYGNMVELDHGNGYTTRYAHASVINVKLGDVVRRGQEIAKVGNTGRSTGPHLHYEVRKHGKPQNPIRYVRGRI